MWVKQTTLIKSDTKDEGEVLAENIPVYAMLPHYHLSLDVWTDTKSRYPRSPKR